MPDFHPPITTGTAGRLLHTGMANAIRALAMLEAASPFGWDRYVGPDGVTIGVTGFGVSAPAEQLYRHFGLTAEAVIAAAEAKLQEA